MEGVIKRVNERRNRRPGEVAQPEQSSGAPLRARHQAGGRRGPNLFLSTIGATLLVLAAVGFFLGRSEVIITGFLVVGGALCLIAVLWPRMEGGQELTLTGFKFNLNKINEGERAIAAGDTTNLEDIQ